MAVVDAAFLVCLRFRLNAAVSSGVRLFLTSCWRVASLRYHAALSSGLIAACAAAFAAAFAAFFAFFAASCSAAFAAFFAAFAACAAAVAADFVTSTAAFATFASLYNCCSFTASAP
jgi:hypothetical protein